MNVMYKTINESKGKSEKNFGAGFGTIFNISNSKCFLRSKHEVVNKQAKIFLKRGC